MPDLATPAAEAPASAPAPSAPATMHSTVDSWVSERRERRAAAEPARAENGKFVSKNPEAAPVEEAPEATQSEADPQAADEVQAEPETANPTDEQASPPEPETAIEAPQFWDAEGKEAFSKLSPASQKEVAAYEKQRTLAVAKAMQ